VTVTEVVNRLGIPDSVDWGDPTVLTYGECQINLPRTGPARLTVTGPTLDAICAVLNPVPA
jgi:hypothetical protein